MISPPVSQIYAHLFLNDQWIFLLLEERLFKIDTLIYYLREMLLDRVLQVNDVHLYLPLEASTR
jgi:hypothetical protein